MVLRVKDSIKFPDVDVIGEKLSFYDFGNLLDEVAGFYFRFSYLFNRYYESCVTVN